jgi:hypothetical protein
VGSVARACGVLCLLLALLFGRRELKHTVLFARADLHGVGLNSRRECEVGCSSADVDEGCSIMLTLIASSWSLRV